MKKLFKKNLVYAFFKRVIDFFLGLILLNFILLKSIGRTTKPGVNKISINTLKKYCKSISQF